MTFSLYATGDTGEASVGFRNFKVSLDCYHSLLIFVLMLACLGCGGQADGLLPVKGRFRWEDGSELSGVVGSVRFDPVNKKIAAGASSTAGQRGFMSELTADGYFELETYQLVDKKQSVRSGIPPGEYKVRVFLLTEAGDPPLIHPDYEHPLRTPLTVVVEPKGRYELTLDRTFEGQNPRRKTRNSN